MTSTSSNKKRKSICDGQPQNVVSRRVFASSSSSSSSSASSSSSSSSSGTLATAGDEPPSASWSTFEKGRGLFEDAYHGEFYAETRFGENPKSPSEFRRQSWALWDSLLMAFAPTSGGCSNNYYHGDKEQYKALEAEDKKLLPLDKHNVTRAPATSYSMTGRSDVAETYSRSVALSIDAFLRACFELSPTTQSWYSDVIYDLYGYIYRAAWHKFGDDQTWYADEQKKQEDGWKTQIFPNFTRKEYLRVVRAAIDFYHFKDCMMRSLGWTFVCPAMVETIAQVCLSYKTGLQEWGCGRGILSVLIAERLGPTTPVVAIDTWRETSLDTAFVHRVDAATHDGHKLANLTVKIARAPPSFFETDSDDDDDGAATKSKKKSKKNATREDEYDLPDSNLVLLIAWGRHLDYVVDAYTGPCIIVIGESTDGCTFALDDTRAAAFDEEMYGIPNFSMIHTRMTVYRRKPSK